MHLVYKGAPCSPFLRFHRHNATNIYGQATPISWCVRVQRLHQQKKYPPMRSCCHCGRITLSRMVFLRADSVLSEPPRFVSWGTADETSSPTPSSTSILLRCKLNDTGNAPLPMLNPPPRNQAHSTTLSTDKANPKSLQCNFDQHSVP